MNKLEVGMYVRLDRNQGIRKIEEYDEDIKRYYLDDDIYDDWGDSICTIEDEKDILKSSFNIIDLIEVGDYVNGKEVKHIAYFEGVEEDIPKLIFVDEHRLVPGETCENDEIKLIVTKEQFESMEYKVGDSNE